MASEEIGAASRAPACLCVLCGLPAAGKSTLGRELVDSAAVAGWSSAVVPYDQLIPDHAFKTKARDEAAQLQASHTEWKSHRQAVLQCIEHFLEETQLPDACQICRAAWERCIQTLPQPRQPDGRSSKPLLLVMDDNFYYSSMRYEVYQLARKHSLGFCQVYLQCDLDLCISRNERRSEPVLTRVLRDMETRLEPPNPEKNAWEQNSVSLASADGFPKRDVQRVMELISTAMSHPLSPVEDITEQSEADRLKCATSALHQADQACRRLTSEAMKTAKGNGASSSRMKALSARLSDSKAALLRDLRGALLRGAAFAREEDADAEGAVKRAVALFDHNRRQILLEVMNDNK